MRLFSPIPILLLAVSSVLARHGHQRRHEDHIHVHARGLSRTTTLTTTQTVTTCPCDSTTSIVDLLESTAQTTTTMKTRTTTSTVTSTVSPTSCQSSSTESPNTSVSTEMSSSSTSSSSTTSETTSSSATEAQTTSTKSSTTSSTTTTTTTSSINSSWTNIPPNNEFSTTGFGGMTKPSSSSDTYHGNVGNPYGSNITPIPSFSASTYKYVVQFLNPSTTAHQLVVIWNKIGPDGKMDGWYNNACHNFTLAPGTSQFYAFDTDSQGAWAAAAGESIPVNEWGSYAATWGEFDFGSRINGGWSGFDVSFIQAQDAGLPVQGMKICSALDDGVCSSVTAGGGVMHRAYAVAQAGVGGIGGQLKPGPVRLIASLGFEG